MNRSGTRDMTTPCIPLEITSVLNRCFNGVPPKGTPAVKWKSEIFERCVQFIHHLLAITEEHHRFVFEEQVVVNTGITDG